MKPTNASALFGAIKGFNRQWTTVLSIRDHHHDIIGWRFECGCGFLRKFLDAHFHDPYGAAVKALNTHRCVTE
jgi:hypothetical protein